MLLMLRWLPALVFFPVLAGLIAYWLSLGVPAVQHGLLRFSIVNLSDDIRRQIAESCNAKLVSQSRVLVVSLTGVDRSMVQAGMDCVRKKIRELAPRRYSCLGDNKPQFPKLEDCIKQIEIALEISSKLIQSETQSESKLHALQAYLRESTEAIERQQYQEINYLNPIYSSISVDQPASVRHFTLAFTGMLLIVFLMMFGSDVLQRSGPHAGSSYAARLRDVFKRNWNA